MDAVDVAVVGGGIVGLATAWALRRGGGRSVVVLEAEERVAFHQSGHNSGVIHAGLYYRPGSMKADLCRRGRAMLIEFCREHGLPFDICGKVIVATDDAEAARLGELGRRAQANGLHGVRRISAEELREVEPHAKGIAALHVPETGIVDYRRVAEKLAALVAGDSPSRVCTRRRWLSVRRDGDSFVHETTEGSVRSRVLVNCAGLYSDRVARACGVDPGVCIVPFRGEYYRLRPGREHLVRNLIYPVADARFPFLGVHFTRGVGGGVEAGPNAVLAWSRKGYRKGDVDWRDAWETLRFPGFQRLALRHLRAGLAESWRSYSKSAFVRALQRLVPEIQSGDVEPHGSGVRAQALDKQGNLVDDFVIERRDRMIHVLNAPSPAATASLAIGEHIAAIALQAIDDQHPS